MKVYCEECMHFNDEWNRSSISDLNCRNENNITKVIYDNWCRRHEGKAYNLKPWVINENNDCQWFKHGERKG